MRIKTIYADILLVINMVIDYLVLFGTARLAGTMFRRTKCLAAAFFGAFYSLIILFPVPDYVFLISEPLVSYIMVLIAFGKRKLEETARLLILFHICSLIFSGFMVLVNNFVHAESFMVKGRTVYFEFSALGTVISCTAAFVLTEILRRLFRHNEPEGICIIRIFHKDKSAVLKGFTDTGNFLSEPFSGTPVALASTESLGAILESIPYETDENYNLSTGANVRYVPCKTVSGTVLIPAFRPDKVFLEKSGITYEAEDIMIGISESVPEKTVILGKNLILKEKDKIISEV